MALAGRRRAVGLGRCCAAAALTLASVIVTTGHAGTRPAAGAFQALCFEHAGPEDKPMPAFCVVAPGRAPVLRGAATESLPVTPQGWQELLATLQDAIPADPKQPAVFGRYQVRSQPPALNLLLTPQTMRQLVALLQRDALRAGGAEPPLLDRLSRRIAG